MVILRIIDVNIHIYIKCFANVQTLNGTQTGTWNFQTALLYSVPDFRGSGIAWLLQKIHIPAPEVCRTPRIVVYHLETSRQLLRARTLWVIMTMIEIFA